MSLPQSGGHFPMLRSNEYPQSNGDTLTVSLDKVLFCEDPGWGYTAVTFKPCFMTDDQGGSPNLRLYPHPSAKQSDLCTGLGSFRSKRWIIRQMQLKL